MARDIRAGRAFVELYLKRNPLMRGLATVSASLRSFGASMTAMGGQMLGLGGAIAAPLAVSVKTAADLAETINRFNAVFGDNAASVGQWATELSESVGRARGEVLNGLSAFQSFFVGLGFGRDQAAEMAKQMQSLAIDFSSFNNLSQAEAQQRFLAAMSGSSEVLDQFGINAKQAALQQELLAMGIDKAWLSVTEQEKALARYSIIAKTMGQQGATGDAVRTADSFANQMQRARAQMLELSATIGRALLPVLGPMLQDFNGVAARVGEFVRNNAGLIVSLAAVAAGATAVGVGLIGVGMAIGTIGSLIGFMASWPAVIGMAGAAMGWFLSRSEAVAQFFEDTFGNLQTILGDTISGIVNAIEAGDLELAGEIAMLGLYSAVLEVRNMILDAWADMLDWLSSMWESWNEWAAKNIVKFFSLGRSKEEVDAVLRAIGEDFDAKRQAREGARSDDAAAAEAREEELRAQQAELRAKANEAKTKAEIKRAEREEGPEFFNPFAGQTMPEFNEPETAKAAARVFGTFSAAGALAGGAAGNLQTRIATASEKQVELLTNIKAALSVAVFA